MKIFFVGMHNKPNTEPLASNTKTGKVIDRIIDKVLINCTHDIRFVRTNLCDVDYFPEKDWIEPLAFEWVQSNTPDENDIIVLLGAFVHNNFPYDIAHGKIIKATHPSGVFRIGSTDDYVSKVASSINNTINQPQK